VCLGVVLLTAVPAFGQETVPDSPGSDSSPPIERSESVVADDENADPSGDAARQPERWTSFLPLLGDEAKKAGYELPLPFGVSFNYMYVSRDVEVESIKVSRNGGRFQSVDDYLSVDANSTVGAYIARLDAFIFPFLNVYFVGGWIVNDSSVEVDVTLPLPAPLPPLMARIEDEGTLKGGTYGGGANLAAGYRSWFGSFDAVYSVAELDRLDSDIRVWVLSGRAGWFGEVLKRDTRIWIGATYWDTARDIHGEVVTPGGDRLRYEVEQGPANPWNMNIGANVQIYGPFQFTGDIGTNYDDMISVVSGLTYRF
jgi:hypothetical protein